MAEPIQRRVIPAFATNVALEADIKANQKNKKEREAHVRLLFFDNKTKFTVAEVILSKLTAVELENGLKELIKKLDEALKKKELPKQEKIKTETVERPTYLG